MTCVVLIAHLPLDVEDVFFTYVVGSIDYPDLESPGLVLPVNVHLAGARHSGERIAVFTYQ